MTAKEYLRGAYLLDQRIKSYMDELSRLRALSSSVSSPQFTENYNPNRPTEAPFVRTLEKIMTMEEKINTEVDRLVSLKLQIESAIDEMADMDERLILQKRYLCNWTWEQIGEFLYMDRSTAHRKHGKALQHFKIPQNPIVLNRATNETV